MNQTLKRMDVTLASDAKSIWQVTLRMAYPTRSLLIVDHEAWIRRTLSLFAAGLGFLVRSSRDGLSALREIRLDQPDVLLAELNLPDMSGPQLLSVVRQRLPATLVIAMSGASGGRDALSRIPADAFYQKGSGPASLSSLLSTPPGIRRQTPPDPDYMEPLLTQHHPCGSNGTAQARITCPECHRAFHVALDRLGDLTCNVECIYCDYAIQYPASMVTPLAKMPPQAARQIAGLAAACKPGKSPGPQLIAAGKSPIYAYHGKNQPASSREHRVTRRPQPGDGRIPRRLELLAVGQRKPPGKETEESWMEHRQE